MQECHLNLSDTCDHFASRITLSSTSFCMRFTNWMVVSWRSSSCYS